MLPQPNLNIQVEDARNGIMVYTIHTVVCASAITVRLSSVNYGGDCDQVI